LVGAICPIADGEVLVRRFRTVLIQGVTLALLLSVVAVAADPASANARASALGARLAAKLASGELPTPEEQQAAWNSLSEPDRQLARDVFHGQVMDQMIAETQAAGPIFPSPEPMPVLASAQLAAGSSRSETTLLELGTLTSALRANPVLGFGSPSEDGDGDALPETLENALAQSFMPEYHVSAGEEPGVGFTRFADQPNLQAGPFLRQQPPVVHTRVTGLGGVWDAGVLYGYIRADFLTIWNSDTGFDTGPICSAIEGILPHETYDVERSALLLAAPVVWTDGRPRYNSDPASYRANFQFTTAHEGFPVTSESRLYRVNPPALPGDHGSLRLYLSKSKHGTYAFNPDGHEVIIQEVRFTLITTTIFADLVVFIDDILGGGQLNRAALITSVVLLIATVIVETCFTEEFSEQGGIVPTDPLNMGEHRRPLPGFTFAAYGKVREKLVGAPVLAPRGSRDCGHTWLTDKVFQPDEYYTGCRGLFIMQSDGNLVLYDEYDTPRWATGTVGWPGAYAVFQSDGNFVVYTWWGYPLWASNTVNRAIGGRLVFQDDGNLVIYSQSGAAVWDRFRGLIPPPPPPPPPPRDCIIICLS
jgi:hypothetical protein